MHQGPWGTARRFRRNQQVKDGTVALRTVICIHCEERFTISHSDQAQDVDLAQRQAAWLEQQLVWDHIQERKHQGLFKLPASDELK